MKLMTRLTAAAVLLACTLHAQEWKPAGERIKTEWASKIDPKSPLPEYPRPQMSRDAWQNLNGLWDYALKPAGSNIPASFDGKILVPYPVESSLSGVMKTVGEKQELWYHRSFTVPSGWKGKDVMLHFGAVDWKADVWVNDVKVGSHVGGYTPFSFNITPWLSKAGDQKLVVRVWDPTDKGYQPRGKQVADPRGIWYTAVTGIWQTVWLEPVSTAHLQSLRITPNIDGGNLTVSGQTAGSRPGDQVEVKVYDQGVLKGSGRAAAGEEVLVAVPDAKLWSPESPFLYDLEVNLLRDGAAIDRVKSYAGMRKISTKADANGVWRMQLNNKDYFQFGPLDQGWWPDGLYTAPTDEALRFDIVQTKAFGFNMIRKHVKVEPARWYYHCDKEGILVWQDMPSGDKNPRWEQRNYFAGQELVRGVASEENFHREWREIMDLCISNPSVVTWVPFNEAWGQFKTAEVVDRTKTYDPSRLVNPASGGNHYDVGDMLDMHHYPDPVMGLYDSKRVNVLGEYGGIGLPLEDHLWEKNRNWGYVQYKTSKEVTDKYVEYAEKLKGLVPFGYSAAVYTQTTDVEIEVNGLMTYDRKKMKLDVERVRKANEAVIAALK
jgi:beta-galactosidase/beta-glucuronidase